MSETMTEPELRPGRGGWNGWAMRHASPELRARMGQLQAEEDRAQRADEQLREQDRERLAAMALRASVLAAQARGEAVNAAQVARDGGVARTKDEAVAFYAALGEQQDRQREAREQQQMRSLLAEMDEHALAEHVGRPDTGLAQAQAAVALATGTARTPAEAVAFYTALGDVQDAQQAAQAQREIRVLRDGKASDVVLSPDTKRAAAILAAHRRIAARRAAS